MNTDPATKPWSFLFFLQCYNLKCHSFHSFNVSSAPGTQSPRSLVERQYTWKHAALHHIFSLCLSIQHKHFSRWGRQGWGWVELGVTFAPSLWYSLLFFFCRIECWPHYLEMRQQPLRLCWTGCVSLDTYLISSVLSQDKPTGIWG